MTDFNLIMLSAMYENGGNTTHRMLDGHPRLFVYPFESQVGTGAGSDWLTSVAPLRYRWPEFSGDATPESAYEAFWDEELKTLLRVPKRSKFVDCGLQMNEAERKAWFANFLRGKPITRANCVEAYYRSTFETWKNYNRSGQETHWVGYNPVQCLDTDKILRDFPDGHVLHVVRNPWSGYADTKKRPFPLSLERYAWLWSLCQHMALVFQEKYAGHFHIMRFEDMVADPRATLGRVLGEIGLPFSDECLHPSFNRKKLEQVYPWGTIRVPTPAANVATANELSPGEKKHMLVQTGVMLKLHGYGQFYDQHLV
jgi:hypothetical protein